VLLAAIVVSAASTPSGQQAGQTGGSADSKKREAQGPTFSTGIEVVSLNVTVTDSANRYVTDLDGSMFEVFEDGVRQDVTYFNRSNQPIALALLLDTSASMEERLVTAQEAAIGFAQRVRTSDVAEVIDFDSRVEIIQPFTNEVSMLERAIRQTAAGGSTALYNAIYISLKELKKIQARNVDEVRRQAIIVLSDGEDTSSLVTFDEVLDLAKRSETAIYAIGLRSKDQQAARGFREAEFALRQLSEETGGRVFFTNTLEELAGVYGQIADELSSQYSIGYTSKNGRRDGSWRRIVVRVNRPNARPRTKQGYYAPTTH
jgi:Ca-activated chloride channel family protein